jgi:hypothetical protein
MKCLLLALSGQSGRARVCPLWSNSGCSFTAQCGQRFADDGGSLPVIQHRPEAVACRNWLTRGAALDRDWHTCTLPGCRATCVNRVVRRRIGGVDTRANLRRLCGRHTEIKEISSSKPKCNCDGKLYLRGCDATGKPPDRNKESSAPNFALR